MTVIPSKLGPKLDGLSYFGSDESLIVQGGYIENL